jgi:high-affinity iron transporter
MSSLTSVQINTLIGSFFVVWRETFEALLIVFLFWMSLGRADLWRAARKHVAAGVAIGIVMSAIFAFAIFRFSEVGESQLASVLKAVFPLVAAGLMLHMVAWMSAHAKELSGEIRSISHRRNFAWGALALIAYSFSREGFETAVYLYGMSLNPANAALGWPHYALLLLAGASASVVSLIAVKRGLGFFNLKIFFRLTNLFLLGTASSLLVTGIDRLIELEYLSPGIEPVWDSSWLVSGAGSLGQILRMIVGYVPNPSLTLVIAYAAFWATALALMARWPFAQKSSALT